MAEIRIVTDSASDLPPEVLDELDVSVVPLVVIVGDASYEETALTRDAFWELADGSVHPQTSQPSVGAFQTTFEELVNRGHKVLCITVTGKHSGTYSSASVAALPFGEAVTVVDSAAFSLAQGFQVLEAARMARGGFDLPAILDSLKGMRVRTRLLIQLDSIEFLRLGGRASKVMPTIDRVARALRLKPVLTVLEGEIKLHGVARTRVKGMERMVQEFSALSPFEGLAVIHIRCECFGRKLADALAAATEFDRGRILFGEAGSVLGCHGGRGVLALAGITAPRTVQTTVRHKPTGRV